MDPSGNEDWIIIPRAPFSEEADEPPSQAQIERKQRSEARLRELGLPTYPWIPPVMDEAVAGLRTLEEITERVTALWHCGLKARILYQGAPAEQEQQECDWLLRQETVRAFNDDERRFLANPQPDEKELHQYLWRFDGLCLLFWALRLWDGPLGPPYAPPGIAVGNDEVMRIWRGDSGRWPELRPIGEILDLYDLTARCFWPSNYFHFNGKPQPPGFNRDVLIEHYHALEWLLCAREWDEWMDGSGEDEPLFVED